MSYGRSLCHVSIEPTQDCHTLPDHPRPDHPPPRVRHYENRDRALAFEKPISLLVLLRAWVLGYLFALGLLMLPSAQNPLAALAQAG